MINIFKNKDEKTIDVGRVNEIIKITNTILKIAFILIIILILFMGTKVLKEWGIFDIIITLISILSPFFIGLVVAWLLNPIVHFLRKKGVNRVVGTISTYIVFLAIVYLIIAAVVPILYDEINEFVKSVPVIVERIKTFIDSFFDKISTSGFDLETVKNDIYRRIEIFATSSTSSIPEVLFGIVKGFFGTIGEIIIGLIIGLYLLFDFDKSIQRIGTIIPLKYQKNINDICSKMDIALKSFVQGTLIVSSIIFAVCSVGFIIAGLKAPILFALFCAITNIIPYAGPYIGAAPAVLIGYSQGPIVGTVVLITCVVVQVIEGNFIQPLVMSKTMKLHPVTIIVGLLIFGYFFGIIGMIISTPIISIIKILFTFINERYQIIDIDELKKV